MKILMVVLYMLSMAFAWQDVRAADCVPQSVLTWVDEREAVAISPTRWQNVRKTLLGQDDGMSLDAMEVIYNRRVSRGWSAGHWVPIIDAVKCLAKPPAVVEEEPEPQPLQAEVEEQPVQDTPSVQDTTTDLSQPPASFVYFDDKEEMESGGETWTQGGYREHGEWIRPGGATVEQRVRAWNKWGPWDDLPTDVRQGIHDSVGIDWAQLASDTYGSNHAREWDSTPDFVGTTGKYRWSGNFTRYELHPGMAKAWSIADIAPKMVFEYNPSDRYAPWFAYVEYKKLDGRTFSADHWYGLKFDGGATRATDATGYDGLNAQWFSFSPFHGDAYEDNPNNMYLVGEVRRPKIIGTFITGTGLSQ